MVKYRDFINPELRLLISKKIGRVERYRSHFVESKTLFIHIPKAAGMSVVSALYNADSSSHLTWRDFYNSDKDKFEQYFKFSFVRNPFDRLCSAYRYLSNGGMNEIDLYWRKKYIEPYRDFEEFVNIGLEIAIKRKAEHFLPQHEFIYANCKTLKVDYLGRYETIDTDFEKICERIGVYSKLPLKNDSGRKKDFMKNFSSDMENTVRKLYAIDFDLLGY